jgi:putative transposase
MISGTITRAYKTELDLNNRQITACRLPAGAARWTYNWALQRKQEAYLATKRSPSAVELHRELNALKKTELPWLYEVSKCAPQEALRNLDRAFAHLFRRCTLKKEGKWRGKLGYPQRKTKRKGVGSFRLTGSIVVFPDAIQLPRLGRLRLKEHGYLPVTGSPNTTVLSATVSELAGHWYVSIQVQQERVVPANQGPTVGVDLGVTRLATLSDGTLEPNPRHLKRCIKNIKRYHRTVSRRKNGSNNRKKAIRKLARLYRTVANQRANMLHQLTCRLAKTKAVVVIEDLNVAGMLKNHHLAQAIADVGFYEFKRQEFKRQLLYKAAWYGSRVVVADRWYPSSKTCSGCGWVDEALTLADRQFRCRNPKRPDCALVLDRDLNAALNLAKLAGSSSESQNAGGAASAGLGQMTQVNLTVGKQEPNTFYSRVE